MQADIILAINEEFGTSYDEAAPWHSLFAEDPLQVHPVAFFAALGYSIGNVECVETLCYPPSAQSSAQ